MKTTGKFGLVAAMLVATSMVANAQDKVEASVSADVVSQYIWRGTQCGEASIQPTIGLGYKGLSLTAWGSTELSNFGNAKEFDLTLAYTTGGFNIGITDYWFSSLDGGDDAGRYFRYNTHGTNHMFEANIGYDFGPVALQWYTYFAGNDYNKTDETTGEAKRAYSSYFEVSAPFKLGGLDWKAALGFSPLETSLYKNDKFAVTNVAVTATKDIVVTPSFTLPVFAGVAANPCTQETFFMAGFTLKP